MEPRTRDRVPFDPTVMGGKPCIRGMRITVGMIVEMVASGHDTDEILNQITPVLAALSEALEPAAAVDADAPVRTCHRYPSNRLDRLDYRGALAKGLPIGSGEIESAHRYVVQQRLKRPGAWWTPDNAEAMLALRVTRANGQWSAYWQEDFKQAA